MNARNVFSGAYALGAPILAVLTGGMCRRRLLLRSLAVFVAANVLAALAPSYGVMVVARVLAALAAGAFMLAASAAAATLAPPEERGRALAAVIGGLALANAVGVPLGTLLGTTAGWRASFVFVALLGLVAFAGIARAIRPLASPDVATLRDPAVAALPGVAPALLVTGWTPVSTAG